MPEDGGTFELVSVPLDDTTKIATYRGWTIHRRPVQPGNESGAAPVYSVVAIVPLKIAYSSESDDDALNQIRKIIDSDLTAGQGDY